MTETVVGLLTTCVCRLVGGWLGRRIAGWRDARRLSGNARSAGQYIPDALALEVLSGFGDGRDEWAVLAEHERRRRQAASRIYWLIGTGLLTVRHYGSGSRHCCISAAGYGALRRAGRP